MGNMFEQQQAGGQGGGQPTDLSSILGEILRELQLEFDPGQSQPLVDYQTVTTHAVFQQLYKNETPVRRAIIQNLSSTDTLTITAKTGTANGINGTTGKGTVLNPASIGGQAGGSLPLNNVDLSQVYITCSTTDGTAFSVYGEL